MTKTAKPAVLTIRNARLTDVAAINDLVIKVYKDIPPYTQGMLRGQIAAFHDGQFVVEYEGEIVGYAAGFRIDEATALILPEIFQRKEFILKITHLQIINQ